MPIKGGGGSGGGGTVTAAAIEATFTASGQIYQGTGSGTGGLVLPPGFEIGYTELTSAISVASTTEASGTLIFSPGSLTFDGAPWICETYCLVSGGSAATNIKLNLFEGSTQITELWTVVFSSASVGNFLQFVSKYRFTPSVGAHTYTFTSIANSVSGTQAKIQGIAAGTASGPPAYVRFTKV